MTYGDSVFRYSPDEIWGQQIQARNAASRLHGLRTIYNSEQEDPRAHATMEPREARRMRLEGYKHHPPELLREILETIK